TGGARSIFAFLYVLCVTAACVLLSRTRGLAIAAVSSMLYTGIVVGRTVLPLSMFFDAPPGATTLEMLTMFLNAVTFLVVAIVAGGLGERYRATRQELETQQKDLRDLQAFKDLVFQSVGTGLIALDREHRITAFNRAAEEIIGVAASEAIGCRWSALVGATVPLASIEMAIDRNPLASLTGAIEVLTSPLTAEDARERLSQIVARESERLNHIIKNFLEYARPAPLSIATFDVAAAAEEVLLLLEHRASPGSLKVIREFATSVLWPVDAQQFRQILWNLCLNAVEAMPEGGV